MISVSRGKPPCRMTKKGFRIIFTFPQLVGLREAISYAFASGKLEPATAQQLTALAAWLPTVPIPMPGIDDHDLRTWKETWWGSHRFTVPGAHLSSLLFALRFTFWLAMQGLVVGQPITYERRIKAIEKIGPVELLATVE